MTGPKDGSDEEDEHDEMDDSEGVMIGSLSSGYFRGGRGSLLRCAPSLCSCLIAFTDLVGIHKSCRWPF